MSATSKGKNKWLTSKAGPVDVLYSVVWDQETLLPSHEDCSAGVAVNCATRHIEFVFDMTEGGEARPVGHIFMLVCAPILRQETIAAPNDLRIEVGGKFRPVVGQSPYAEVPAKE